MHWNTYDRPGYRRVPVRRAPIGGASPYPSQPADPVESISFTQPIAPVEEKSVSSVAETDWQTEMDNFRQRQIRRADEAIAAERERLLRLILPVADNLNRALTYNNVAENNLRQGVELTQRELLRFLAAEGLTQIETVGQPFSPQLHEAVAVVPAQAEPNTIVEEMEAGYMLGDKLLRPARVVVAA